MKEGREADQLDHANTVESSTTVMKRGVALSAADIPKSMSRVFDTTSKEA
jgi:hypothetical protein